MQSDEGQERASIHWFIPQMLTMARAGAAQSQESGTQSGSPALVAGTQALVCFRPRCVRRQDRKQCSWDSPCSSDVGCGVASPVGCQPLHFHLYSADLHPALGDKRGTCSRVQRWDRKHDTCQSRMDLRKGSCCSLMQGRAASCRESTAGTYPAGRSSGAVVVQSRAFGRLRPV